MGSTLCKREATHAELRVGVVGRVKRAEYFRVKALMNTAFSPSRAWMRAIRVAQPDVGSRGETTERVRPGTPSRCLDE